MLIMYVLKYVLHNLQDQHAKWIMEVVSRIVLTHRVVQSVHVIVAISFLLQLIVWVSQLTTISLIVTSAPFTIDIVECFTNNGGCSHSCINTRGSYHCRCPDEYTLLPDGHNCVKGKVKN